MRRLVVIAPILVVAAVLLTRRRRRRADARNPLSAAGVGVRTTTPPPSPPAPPADGARFVSVPWTPADAPADRAELTIRHACAESMELDRVDAQETPTQVFVTALMRWQPPADEHVGWQGEREATVELSQPLGTRSLVHAPVDLEPDPEPDEPERDDDATGSDPDGAPLYP